MNYGQKIRYIRMKILDITLNDLAIKSNLSISYLSDAELGRVSISIKALEKVAEALNVTSSFLLDQGDMTLKQLSNLHNVEFPEDINEFIVNQKNLSYVVLAKKMSEEGFSPEEWELMFNTIKQLINVTKGKLE